MGQRDSDTWVPAHKELLHVCPPTDRTRYIGEQDAGYLVPSFRCVHRGGEEDGLYRRHSALGWMVTKQSPGPRGFDVWLS